MKRKILGLRLKIQRSQSHFDAALWTECDGCLGDNGAAWYHIQLEPLGDRRQQQNCFHQCKPFTDTDKRIIAKGNVHASGQVFLQILPSAQRSG
ncbi:hypothetical protein WA1_49900 [Scytonema hofmannii PCC 7110]|uniref:Uncharacterized protein n=1 Tax=Scytonema hofmannii PCC 7110 TaxID=128403 RepID=A0A139WR03_9CYAN|nr:hypothetical protein WA1_49900 [Scytonema hofmannii PCC 7110]